MKKSEILLRAGYKYDFNRDLYINQAAQKAFSLEFVDDHSEDELARRIEENSNGTGWKFYFNSEPSAGIRRELERVLG